MWLRQTLPAALVATAVRRFGSAVVYLAISLSLSGFVFAQPKSKDIVVPLPNGASVTLPKSDKVILSAKEYKELLDRLEKLQELVDAQQPSRPRSCEMEGRIEQRGKQAVVRLKTTFKFSTSRPNAILHLGCQKAQAVEAKLDDGKAPLLSSSDDGLRIQVENPGDHTLRLELDIAVTARGTKGAELGFELTLPGCPITLLSFEAPAGVRRYTLSTRASKPGGAGPAAVEPDIEQPEADRLAIGKGGMALGAVTSLALAWDDPARKADAAVSAETDTLVTFGQTEIVTEAKLRLRGSLQEWKFTAPANADVNVGAWPAPGMSRPGELPADRAPNVIRPDPGSTVWKLVFREAATADLLVSITTRADRPRGPDAAKSIYPVGPFAALGVRGQTGIIRVRTPSNWKATARLKGDTRREADEGSGELAFRYRYGDLQTPPSAPPMELSFSQIPGVVQARVRNELRLTETSWQLRSEISISPTRVEVEFIDFEAPAGFRASAAEPREIVEDLTLLREIGGDRRVYRARLTSPRRTSFSFTLEGDYPHRPDESNASVALPRLLGVTERSNELIVNAPSRFDIRGAYRTWEGAKPGTWETAIPREPSESGVRLRASIDRPVASAELAWRLAPVNASLRSEADVDLEENFVRVVQRLSFRFTGKPPSRVRLRIDRMPTSLRVSRGSIEPVGVGYDYVLPDEMADGEIVLNYSIPLPAGDGIVVVPFLLPDGIDCMNHTRIWVSDSRTANLQDSVEWSRSPTEAVADRNELPSLTLTARSAAALPKITLGPRDESSALKRIERSVVEVRLSEDDAVYRASYWLREGIASEFVLPFAAQGVEVFVQGKRLAVKPTGIHSNTIRIPRIKNGSGLVRVEFRYRGPKGDLQAPTPAAPLEAAEATWSVAASPGHLLFVPGDATGSWSPASFLSVLGIGSPRLANGEWQFASRDADVIVRQAAALPLKVRETPRPLWLLGWSVGVFGLLAAFAFVGRRSGVAASLGLCVVTLAGAILLPQPTAQAVFAAAPGLAAFVLLRMAVTWARVRYRRRVSRSIGFSKNTSSLARPASVRMGEPTSRKSAAVPVTTPVS